MTVVSYLVFQALDGKVAVEMVAASLTEGNAFDIVFLDCVMPNLTGPAAAKQMRAHGKQW